MADYKSVDWRPARPVSGNTRVSAYKPLGIDGEAYRKQTPGPS